MQTRTLFVKKIPIDFNNGTAGIVNNSTTGTVKIDMDAIAKEVNDLTKDEPSKHITIKSEQPVFETIENDFYVIAFEIEESIE